MLPKTSVLTTLSLMNIATRRAGSATESNLKPNRRIRKYAARMIAIVLKVMNQYRDASTGR